MAGAFHMRAARFMHCVWGCVVVTTGTRFLDIH